MDFSMNDEQVALQEAVRRFCERACGSPSSAVTRPATSRLDCWPAMAELGLPGLTLGGDVGGSAQTAVEVGLVVDELGRYLLAGRFIESSVLCGTLLDRVVHPSRRRELLAPVAAGSRRLAVATEDGMRDGESARTTARYADGRWRVDGVKAMVMDADSADVLLVTARLNDSGTLALFAVAVDMPGVRLETVRRLDGETVAVAALEGVSLDAASRLDEPGSLDAGLAIATDAAQAALCAERAGILTSLLEMTIEHLKTRRQFGRPLADFQALQHQLADIYIQVEQCRSLAQLAAMAVARSAPARSGPCPEASAVARSAGDASAIQARALPAAAAYTQEAAQLIAERVTQLHGAMGMTEECAMGHYVRRLIVSAARFGGVGEQLRRFGAIERMEAHS